MKTLLILAWRNIWRNKRRTYITAASIMLAVFLSGLMKSVQKGAWDHMVDNVVNYYFGYAQIHQKGYWDDQTIDNSFLADSNIYLVSQRIPNLRSVVPRLESFALASHTSASMGVLLIGIDPVREDQMTGLAGKLVQGKYIEANEQAVLVAEGVGKNLKLGIGDTLVLISQGYHGQNAAGKYPIKGILKFGSPELNKQMVYLPLTTAQYFYGADNRLTSLALNISSKDYTKKVIADFNTTLNPKEYEILDWQTMIPDLVEAKALDEASANITLGILYIIIAFGLFGTILMMTRERRYEFGVLISIGMSRWKLGLTIFMETLLLGILGAALGIILSIPIIGYFYKYPIRFTGDMAAAYEKFGVEAVLPTAFEWQIFMGQAIIIFIMAAILAAYPLWSIWRLRPVEAMRI